MIVIVYVFGASQNEHELLEEFMDLGVRCPTLKLILSMSDPSPDSIKRAQANVWTLFITIP